MEEKMISDRGLETSMRVWNNKLQNIEQVVQNLPNLLKQLLLMDDHLPSLGCYTLSDPFTQVYLTNLFPNRVIAVIEPDRSLKYITVSKCMETHSRLNYQG